MKKIVLSAMLLLAFLLSSCNDTPIKGKWQAATDDLVFDIINCRSLEFTSTRMYMCGMSSKVKYVVEGNKVVVDSGDDSPLVCVLDGDDKMHFEINNKRLDWNRVK